MGDGEIHAHTPAGTRPAVHPHVRRTTQLRIQWTEEGKRRSRTVGPNSAETRRRADAELEEILGLMPTDTKQDEGAAPSIQEALRQLVLAILEAADRLIDRLRGAMHADEPKEEPAEDAAEDDAEE